MPERAKNSIVSHGAGSVNTEHTKSVESMNVGHWLLWFLAWFRSNGYYVVSMCFVWYFTYGAYAMLLPTTFPVPLGGFIVVLGFNFLSHDGVHERLTFALSVSLCRANIMNS